MKRAPASGIDTSVTPRVRRGYFECRFGQLHVHHAMPPGGGFDEGTALLCLHAMPGTGRAFQAFLEIMGRDRSAYAPDVPGYGQSDGPAARPTIADYASALGDFLGAMRFRQIDLLGQQAGGAVAVELAIARPQQVRRVVLVGVPLFNEAERRQLEPAGADWGMSAVAQYAMRERLALVTQPVLVLRARDDLWEATQRTREVLPRARVVDMPDHGNALFDAAPGAVAEAVRDFLKG